MYGLGLSTENDLGDVDVNRLLRLPHGRCYDDQDIISSCSMSSLSPEFFQNTLCKLPYCIGLWLAALLLSFNTGAIADTRTDSATGLAEAETSGACSPVLVNVRVVTLNCPGIPENALEELVKQLNTAQVGALEAQKRADEFRQKYFELVEYLTKNSGLMSPEERNEAQTALLKGQLGIAESHLAAALERIENVRGEYRAQSAVLMRQLSDQGLLAGGVIHTHLLWPTGSEISVCFLNGSEEDRTFIADVASTWSLYGNIDFDFGRSLGGVPRICSEDFNSDIRITTQGTGNFSYLGTSALQIKGLRPTLSISKNTLRNQSETIIRNVILHEFGHALALSHTNLHPDFCVDEIDWNFVFGYFEELAWTREMVKRNLIAPSSQSDKIDFGVYDRNSIMQHHFPAEFYYEGEKSRCFGKANGLQVTDRLAVFATYPYEVSTK